MSNSDARYQAGYDAYPANDNPYAGGSYAWQEWDQGYWNAHDDSFVASGDGFEDGYGNFLDYDAVSQGFYDDDPSPYDGTYSEM